MFKKMFQEKREYREYKSRINVLPEEHKKAMNAIEKYMWTFAKGSSMLEY
jgi:DNA-binding ferritin-like protein (Dps family)